MTNGDNILWWHNTKDNICSGTDTVGLSARCSIILATCERMSFTLDQMTFHQGQSANRMDHNVRVSGHDRHEDYKVNNSCVHAFIVLSNLWLNSFMIYKRCLSVLLLLPSSLLDLKLSYSIRSDSLYHTAAPSYCKSESVCSSQISNLKLVDLVDFTLVTFVKNTVGFNGFFNNWALRKQKSAKANQPDCNFVVLHWQLDI